jgi:hypothetical protein
MRIKFPQKVGLILTIRGKDERLSKARIIIATADSAKAEHYRSTGDDRADQADHVFFVAGY